MAEEIIVAAETTVGETENRTITETAGRWEIQTGTNQDLWDN